jgi:phosphoglycolate phosphatase-like HAD superfamily hydrolase
MTSTPRRGLVALAVLIATLWFGSAGAQPKTPPQSAPLTSWNDGPTKARILSFVAEATTRSSPGYVAPEDRIATFDQDGTLWAEHPLYAQAQFALDRLKQLAPGHPEWKQQEPFSAVLRGDREAIGKFAEQDWAHIIAATHAGMTTEQFLGLVRDWLGTARDPRWHQPYARLAYQPMLELLDYLRANGFKTYIVTGGGQEFVRVYSERVYGIPPEQVVGSSVATRYEIQGGAPVLMRQPKVFFDDDHAGKAIGINLFIGKRPYAAFGNSDGDREMLETTTTGAGARLGALVLHDDAVREYAYGPATGLPDTTVGSFPQSLADEARSRGWIVISMKNDWNRIFDFDR